MRGELARLLPLVSEAEAARPLVPSGSPGGDCLAVLEAVTAGLARLGPMAAVAAHEAAAHLTGGLWLAPAVPPLAESPQSCSAEFPTLLGVRLRDLRLVVLSSSDQFSVCATPR